MATWTLVLFLLALFLVLIFVLHLLGTRQTPRRVRAFSAPSGGLLVLLVVFVLVIVTIRARVRLIFVLVLPGLEEV